jgi:hypothetical protein
MVISAATDAGCGFTPSNRALQIFPAAASANVAASRPAASPTPQQVLANRPLSWLAS